MARVMALGAPGESKRFLMFRWGSPNPRLLFRYSSNVRAEWAKASAVSSSGQLGDSLAPRTIARVVSGEGAWGCMLLPLRRCAHPEEFRQFLRQVRRALARQVVDNEVLAAGLEDHRGGGPPLQPDLDPLRHGGHGGARQDHGEGAAGVHGGGVFPLAVDGHRRGGIEDGVAQLLGVAARLGVVDSREVNP